MRSAISPVACGELRDSAAAWAAVGLTFVATTFALVLSLAVLDTGLGALGPGAWEESVGAYYVATGAFNLVLVAVVALAVISASTGLVVAARRPALARLALAGATPGQIVRLVLGQLVVVTVLAATLGTALAVLALDGVLGLLAADRGPEAAPAAVVQPGSIAVVVVAAVALAVLGGLKQARVASRVGPLEAQRQATTGVAARSRPALVGRIVLVAVLALATAGAIAAVPGLVRAMGDDAGPTVLQTSVAVLGLAGATLAAAAPLVVGPLTALWTRAFPGGGAAWHLASRTVVVRSERLARSVVPVMFSVGLVLGMVAIGASFNATFTANGLPVLEGVSTVSILSMIGPALLVSVAGAIGNLVMMSRAREAELAVAGVVTLAAVLATTLPVLRSVRLPERAVVASRIAD